MKVSNVQSPKEEKADKKSEIIKIELQKYRMLKAKTAASKEAEVSTANNESLGDTKNTSILSRNRISVAELLSPQTYQNLLLIKDDPFKRTKTPEKTTPMKKIASDKENYITPTLSSLSTSINNSKSKNHDVRSPDNKHAHEVNMRSTHSSAFKDYDEKNYLYSHEDKSYCSKPDRKSTPLLPKSQNKPQNSNSATAQRTCQPSKTPERTLPRYGSNKKLMQDIRSPPNEPSLDELSEMRSPSVRKSNIPKPAAIAENSYEALADLKRTLSKKKLNSNENESNDEADVSKLKKNHYKRASTPENHSKRESYDGKDKTSALNHSGSKQNLHPTLSREPSVSRDMNITKEGNLSKETSDRALIEEVEKWKKFGKMMADSYEELNNKFTSFMKEGEKDKKVIHALKDQVTKLKSLIKLQSDTNTSTTQDLKKSSNLHINTSKRINEESYEDEEDIEFLKNENKSLRKTVEELQKIADESAYYKKLAESKFRECSALAEEIICLRTDLDRSHTNYLRIQRQHGSGSKLSSAVSESYLPKAYSNVRNFGDLMVEPERQAPPARHKEYRRDDDESIQTEGEDDPPSPQKFTIRPTRDERNKN